MRQQSSEREMWLLIKWTPLRIQAKQTSKLSSEVRKALIYPQIGIIFKIIRGILKTGIKLVKTDNFSAFNLLFSLCNVHLFHLPGVFSIFWYSFPTKMRPKKHTEAQFSAETLRYYLIARWWESGGRKHRPINTVNRGVRLRSDPRPV